MMGTDGDALASKVIRTYLEDMPAGIARMQAAAAARDAEALQKAAHSMKSSSANVGAERLARLCRDLEMIGRSGTTDGTSSLLEDATGEFARVAAALGAQLARRPPQSARLIVRYFAAGQTVPWLPAATCAMPFSTNRCRRLPS